MINYTFKTILLSGGEIGVIFMFILIGIGYLITTAYKKVDAKVDGYKLTRNQADIDTLEKVMLKSIQSKRHLEALETANTILETDPVNLLALMYAANNFHESRDYIASTPLLQTLSSYLNDNDVLRRLRNKSFSLTDTQKMDDVELMMAKACYYYGHVCSMNHQPEEADRWQKRAKGLKREVISYNLY